MTLGSNSLSALTSARTFILETVDRDEPYWVGFFGYLTKLRSYSINDKEQYEFEVTRSATVEVSLKVL